MDKPTNPMVTSSALSEQYSTPYTSKKPDPNNTEDLRHRLDKLERMVQELGKQMEYLKRENMRRRTDVSDLNTVTRNLNK